MRILKLLIASLFLILAGCSTTSQSISNPIHESSGDTSINQIIADSPDTTAHKHLFKGSGTLTTHPAKHKKHIIKTQ